MGPGGLAITIFLVMLLAGAVSRLLGVRLSVGRALLVGSGGLAVGLITGLLVYFGHHPAHFTALVLAAGLVAAVVATMFAILMLELLARPGRAELPPGRPHPWRALRRMGQSARRYAQLTRIIARYRLSGVAIGRRVAPEELGRRLRLALEEAGPIFVKLGQVLSTRTDVLPEAVTTELAQLQDHVPPAPWPQVHDVLEEELAKEPDELFGFIDPEPVASASLAKRTWPAAPTAPQSSSKCSDREWTTLSPATWTWSGAGPAASSCRPSGRAASTSATSPAVSPTP
jgi:ubiquinone biosynthesis protein